MNINWHFKMRVHWLKLWLTRRENWEVGCQRTFSTSPFTVNRHTLSATRQSSILTVLSDKQFVFKQFAQVKYLIKFKLTMDKFINSQPIESSINIVGFLIVCGLKAKKLICYILLLPELLFSEGSPRLCFFRIIIHAKLCVSGQIR